MSGPGYDYFAGTPRATSAFGPPPPLAEPAPFGGPYAGRPEEPTAPAPRRHHRPATALVAVAAVLAVAVGGGAWWWTHRGDGLPDHLGPYARSTDPALTSAMDAAREQAGTRSGALSDARLSAAAYGSSAQGAFLFVLDGSQISPAIDAQLSALPGGQQVGADRCLAMGRATMCVRAEDGRAVMVVASGDPADSSGVPLTTRVAGWTDTAWADTQ